MRRILLFLTAIMTFAILSVASAYADCESCSHIDCSGSGIHCDNQWTKPLCELNKKHWMHKCEIEKQTCYKTCVGFQKHGKHR
jgi:hypothetical protein